MSQISLSSARPVLTVISDSIGETAELVVRAAASQFDGGLVEVHRVPYVNDVQEIPEIVEAACASGTCLIAYTLVSPEIRQALLREAGQRGVPVVDILTPMVETMARAFARPPRLEPGLVRRLDDDYFRRMEAIEFAFRYDDGKDPRGLLHADVVVIGISRTSKTPLCMYLAHKLVKAANVPLVPEVAPPEEIFRLPPHRLIGLTIDAAQLNGIRSERLRALGLTVSADYASLPRIYKELEYAQAVMKRANCTIIDVTSKAVEETASRVLEIYYRGERHVR